MGEARGGWRRASLGPRTATIVLGAPILLGALWVGGPALAAVVLILTALGTREFAHLAAAGGLRPSPVLMAGALVFPALAGLGRWEGSAPAVGAIVLAAGGLALTSARRPGALGNAAADVLGALYVGGLFAYVVLLRGEVGRAAVLAVLGMIWANDIAAYFVGVAWGRRKLAPAISPGKSVEGFVAGLLGAAAVAAGIGVAAGWPPVRLGAVGLAVALAAVVGDLWESALKRSAGVKDSGTLLPGHGGVLDRFDAVLFGVPVGYYLWRWLL